VEAKDKSEGVVLVAVLVKGIPNSGIGKTVPLLLLNGNGDMRVGVPAIAIAIAFSSASLLFLSFYPLSIQIKSKNMLIFFKKNISNQNYLFYFFIHKFKI